MNQATGEYIVKDDSIEFANGQQLILSGEIFQVADFDEAIVVLIDWMVTNRNVFGISQNGKQLWQIQEQPAIHTDNPCTYLERQNEFAFVGTWDGLELLVEPLTGQIIKERRERGIITEWIEPS